MHGTLSKNRLEKFTKSSIA